MQARRPLPWIPPEPFVFAQLSLLVSWSPLFAAGSQRAFDASPDQWARRYPKDPWLASTGVLIATGYAELPGNVAREHAVAIFVYVKTHFPLLSYGAASRAALRHGVSTKADPP